MIIKDSAPYFPDDRTDTQEDSQLTKMTVTWCPSPDSRPVTQSPNPDSHTMTVPQL